MKGTNSQLSQKSNPSSGQKLAQSGQSNPTA
jgi:hypothetical protein